MPNLKKLSIMASVALRKESVDRNTHQPGKDVNSGGSLSARRAWIEMAMWVYWLCCGRCRSPQGERG